MIRNAILKSLVPKLNPEHEYDAEENAHACRIPAHLEDGHTRMVFFFRSETVKTSSSLYQL
jgi:hypothetical protein